MIKIHAHLVGEEICLKQDKERQCPSPMRWLVLWHVESNCNASKCSASRQQVQEYRERSEARDCQQPRLLLGKLLPSSQTLFYPCCRTPSEGGGRSPVSRCPPEPTQSQSGSFRRLGLPGKGAGLKRNGKTQSICLHCVGVAVVERVFFCIAVVW